MKELKKPPTGTETGEATAASWKWFSLMDEAIGSRPSVTPPCLIASAWEESPSTSAASSVSMSQPQEQDEDGESRPGGKRKRKSLHSMLERAERREEEREKKEEERERREEERQDRLCRLLERLVEKLN